MVWGQRRQEASVEVGVVFNSAATGTTHFREICKRLSNTHTNKSFIHIACLRSFKCSLVKSNVVNFGSRPHTPQVMLGPGGESAYLVSIEHGVVASGQM